MKGILNKKYFYTGFSVNNVDFDVGQLKLPVKFFMNIFFSLFVFG